MRPRAPKPDPKPRARCRVTNWRDYNRALVARGSITLWIDEAVVAGRGAAGGAILARGVRPAIPPRGAAIPMA